MSSLEPEFEAARHAVAAVRREIWPDYDGAWPEEATPDEMNRYIEALEAEVGGRAMAMRMIGRGLTSPRL